MSYFITHPSRLYMDEAELERAAGRLEQIQKTAANEHNAFIAQCGAAVLRLISENEYKTYSELVEAYLLCLDWQDEGGEN